MKTFDYYEFAGVLAPGALVLFGLGQVYPVLGALVSGEQMTFGALGLLLVLAYVGGQLLQAVGVVLELLWWKLAGGWPSDWVRSGRRPIIARAQRHALPECIRKELHLACPDDLATIAPGEWRAVTRQVHAAVRRTGQGARLEIFNGNYGMFRGIAAALLVILGALLLEHAGIPWRWLVALLLLIAAALYSMHRFGAFYAAELYVQFIHSSLERARREEPQKPAPSGGGA